jgi:cytochrome c biogenesis protein
VDVLAAASGASSADLAPGQVAFLVYRDGESDAMGMEVVDQGSSAAIGDLTFGFNRESQYTGIMVREDPGSIWMWVGSILLVVGMTVTFTCRHRRVWVRAQDGTLLFASADKEDSSFRHSFTTLVSQAETWTSK